MGMYTVETVQPKATFKNDYGEFQVYALTLTDGTTPQNVEMNQKITTPAPTVGQRLEGEISTDKNGYLKFKKAQQQNGGGGGRGPRDPKETAQITRQHSQEMAILWAATLEKQGRLPADAKVDTFLKPIIDWFQADAEAAVPS